MAMKRKIVLLIAVVVLALMLLSGVVVAVVLSTAPKSPVVVIATFGDSITDVSSYGRVMDYWQLFPFGYQATMYSDLRRSCSMETRIRNFGIGGQTASQVCNRLPMGVPADYVTILAGINDVNLAVYSNNATTLDKLSMSIVQTVTQGINTLRFVQPTVVIVI